MEPSLGIVAYRDGKSFVMADIPGIIEGASEGRGLGLRFLRHIERNSLLLFMVPGDTDDIRHEYDILLNELQQFNPEMLSKHRVLAVTKCDLLDQELIDMLRPTLPDDLPVVFISAVTGFGLDELKDVLWRELNSESNKLEVITSTDTLIHRDKDLSHLALEMEQEGEDDDIEYIDEDDLDLRHTGQTGRTFGLAVLLLLCTVFFSQGICAQSIHEFTPAEQQSISVPTPGLFDRSNAFEIDFTDLPSSEYSFPLPVGKAELVNGNSEMEMTFSIGQSSAAASMHSGKIYL